ncbi:anti-repressor SinI family protein [Evansella tamaricis]|uniref:Anti-repressor SinI family protein n=1 Tax=Evansella tamaricis TaxID=2069301 RepID=A0ABS6JFW7_9BACI|nr:anti-repressor SinI family protein [Evansella tamaricis]MBU9712104.1 anti-repressor SinI family protein [Evansella tamaricis]
MVKEVDSQLDVEWVELIKEALQMGMSEEEIRIFLKRKQAAATSV